MFCKNCGSSLRDTARFCGKCGTPVTASAAAAPAPAPAPAPEREPAQAAMNRPEGIAAPVAQPKPLPMPEAAPVEQPAEARQEVEEDEFYNKNSFDYFQKHRDNM